MTTRDRFFAFALAAIVTPACASVIGADFDNVHPQPTSCNLVAPSSHDPTHYIECPESEGCYVTDPGKTQCLLPRDAGAGTGGRCEYANDCAPGLTCTSILGCVGNCRVGGRDCDTECIAFNDHPTIAGVEYGFCAPAPCDPSSRRLAGGGLTGCATQCRFISNTSTGCLTTVGTVTLGGACSQDSDCVATANCAPAPSGSGTVCAQTCRVGQSDCPSGQTCHGALDDTSRTTLNGVEYGYCGR